VKGLRLSVPNTTTGPGARLYYLDWLRVGAIIGIFFFHNARFYDVFSDWHVRNATTNLGASILVAFLVQWIMPLFFLIAGAGTYFALKSKKTGQFVQERTLRLLVPFVFGMLVIVVPQAYFQALYHGVNLAGYNIFQIYWLYLQTLPDLETFHLWFLEDLFIISLVTIPIFFTWKGSDRSVVSRVAMAVSRPWILVPLLVIPITLVNIFLYQTGFWGYRNGGFNFVAYLLFYVFGFLIFANPKIMETIKKFRWLWLGIAIVAMGLLGLFVDVLADSTKYFGSTAYNIAQFVQALSTWAWLLAILGLGSHYLVGNNRFLSYANEAVLPFYILHQTIIISIGFYVVQWNTGVGLKYLTTTATSFVAIMLIYELLVRRINILRFLFGMRLKRIKKAGLAKAQPIPLGRQ
jgi:glucan biosynthesis protein C